MSAKEDQKRMQGIVARLTAASPGPWKVGMTMIDLDTDNPRRVPSSHWVVDSENSEVCDVHVKIADMFSQTPENYKLQGEYYKQQKNNRDFIAHAKEDIEWLLGMLKAGSRVKK